MNPRTLLICDTCSKAEYTRFISLCSVSVPYVRLYISMGLGYIIAGSCQSGIYGTVSLAISHHPAPCTLHPAPCTLLLHLTYTYYVSYIFMFTCAWNMKQMILYEMKSSYMVSPVHTGLVHFLHMNILLCLNHETNNSLLNKIYKIISSTSILNSFRKFMQPLPHTQVDWLILPHLLFYPTFKDVLSIRWVMRMSDSV